MNLSLTIKIALKNILGNRLRSGLTILGLVIGIASVILLVGLVNVAAKSVSEQFASFGADLIQVYVYDEEKALTDEDLQRVQGLDKVLGAAPRVMLDASISREGQKAGSAELYGTGANFTDMMGYEIEKGRDISKIDVDNGTKCAVLGNKIAGKYWHNSDPCGDAIKLNGDDYIVIGVLKSSSSMSDMTANQVFIPISTAGYLGASAAITEFYVRAASEDDVDMVTEELKSFLSDDLGLSSDSCELYSEKEMRDSMNEVNRTMALLLGGIASISLLVGGIGVMNVMLVSVTERTREIGIRKSLGAKRKDIMFQFLIESMVLSLAGGLIGVITGLVFGRVAILVGAQFSPDIFMIFVSVGVSMAVGLIFGILPARRAAGLRPVEALRYE